LVWTRSTSLPETEVLWQRIILNNIVLVPGICALLFGLIREQTSLQRLLATQSLELLGRASYIFYLIHMGVLSRSLDFHISSNLLIKFIITNGIALVLFKYIEEPLNKRIAKG
jgi:peptidoglycan/LPS O-acetylase OafA/YrhL